MSDYRFRSLTSYTPVPAPDFESEYKPVPISRYLWVLQRHAWKIVLFVAVCVTATYVVCKRLTPLYESTVLVDVDRQAPSAVVGQDATQTGALSDADQFLSTQMRLIQSDAVVRPVAEKYHLLDQERQTTKGASQNTTQLSQAPIALSHLTINRPPNTYLLMISYRSPNPRQAADVANGIAHSYLQNTYTLRVQSATNLANFMDQQLGGLRDQIERSSQVLADFERDLNVINPEDKTNILSARLLQLNTEYTAAQADRVRKEAIWNSVKGGSLASVQISGQAEYLAQLNQRLDQAEQKFATVRATYGSVHPEYKKAASEVAELRSQFSDLQKNITDRVRVDYEQVSRREQMLQDAVAQTKAEYDHVNARSYEYQGLKREADAYKKVYDELTTKIREAGINAGFQSNVIRIADYARPAAHPVLPTTHMNLVLAFLFSSVVAVAAAVISDLMDTTLRDAEQASKYLGTDVIGTLPAVKEMNEKKLLGSPQTGTEMLVNVNGKATKTGRRKAGHYGTRYHYGEAIRTVRSTISLKDSEGRLRSILVTSAASGEGKTTTAVALGIANASQGNKTLIIDADLRRPSVHRRLGVPEGPGFSDVLTGDVPWRQTVRQIESIPLLSLIPAGPPSHRAADVIGPRIGDLLDEVAREFDLIIIDSPSFLGFADPLQMAKAADGVLIIGEAGVTRRDAVSRVMLMLSLVRANVLGVVLNKVRPQTSNGYSEYVEFRHSPAV